MFDTGQTTFAIPPPIFIIAPEPPPTSPTLTLATIDPDVMDYRMYRKNALWFAKTTDGYSNGEGHSYVEIPKGHSKKCAEKYFAKCVDLLSRPGAPVVAHIVSGTISADATNAPSADSSKKTECLCIECLRLELDTLYSMRV